LFFTPDGNLILQQAFKTKSDRHRIAVYNSIMTCLAARGLSVDLQILNNEASLAYKEAITFKWNATFQLVPPDMHHCNRAEHAIRTFKNHFLAILAELILPFHPTFGTSVSHKPNSLSIYCVNPRSTLRSVHGSSFRGPLISTKRH
jgi:hypothetical protein